MVMRTTMLVLYPIKVSEGKQALLITSTLLSIILVIVLEINVLLLQWRPWVLLLPLIL